MLKSAFDIQGLAHIGFACDPAIAASLGPEADLVATEDALAHRFVSLMLSILKHRCSSLAWHTIGFPGCTALMVHDDSAIAQKGLAKLKACVAAWRWSSSSSANGAAIAKRCMLGGAIMQRIISLAEESNYSEVGGALKQLLTSFWTGALQTVVNEKANQRLRDCETRDSSSKVIARLSRWHVLRTSNLISHYGGKDVDMLPHEPSPPDLDMDSLFRFNDDTWPLDLKAIMKDQCWGTANSQGIKRSFSDMNLMLQAHHRQRPEMFSETWKTALLPEKQVVIVRPAPGVTDCYLALANLQSGVLAWPLVRHEHLVEVVHDEAAVTEVLWKTVDDINCVYILPCEAGSPLNSLILKKSAPSTPIGCQLRIVGKPTLLKDWHASRGFAGVPEFALRAMHLDSGCEDLVGVVEGASCADQLACSLVMHIKPKMTSLELDQIMQSRRLNDCEPLLDEDTELTQDMLDDVMLASDRKDAADKLKEMKDIKVNQAKRGRL